MTTNGPKTPKEKEREALAKSAGKMIASAVEDAQRLLGYEPGQFVKPIAAFGDATAAPRLAIRQLVFEDLGEHVEDPTINGLYEAAKQLQEEADTFVEGLAE